MSETLEILFGSKARVRVMRFLLLNPELEFDAAEIARKNMLKRDDVHRELANFKKIRFVTEKLRKRKKYYSLNSQFAFYPELRSLIVKSNIYPQCRSLGRVRGIGDVKLALVSGVFLNYPKSKADMVVVADNVSRGKLRNLMSSLEAEIGKEITYVLMTGEELKYRLNMLDRFLLEFLEGPHSELVNKVSGLKRFVAGLKK
jgi:hypothetical protein